jgi:hypothetical protein
MSTAGLLGLPGPEAPLSSTSGRIWNAIANDSLKPNGSLASTRGIEEHDSLARGS